VKAAVLLDQHGVEQAQQGPSAREARAPPGMEVLDAAREGRERTGTGGDELHDERPREGKIELPARVLVRPRWLRGSGGRHDGAWVPPPVQPVLKAT
jgi:hypothetical protein